MRRDLRRDYGKNTADLPERLRPFYYPDGSPPRIQSTRSSEVLEFEERHKAKVFVKSKYSCFKGTELDKCLKELRVGTGPLYFAGVHVSGCIAPSMKEACRLRYTVFAIEEAICTIPARREAGFLRDHENSTISVKDLVISRDLQSEKDLVNSIHQNHLNPPQLILFFDRGCVSDWRVMIHCARMGIAYHPSELNNPDEITPVLLTEDGTDSLANTKSFHICSSEPEEYI